MKCVVQINTFIYFYVTMKIIVYVKQIHLYHFIWPYQKCKCKTIWKMWFLLEDGGSHKFLMIGQPNEPLSKEK